MIASNSPLSSHTPCSGLQSMWTPMYDSTFIGCPVTGQFSTRFRSTGGRFSERKKSDHCQVGASWRMDSVRVRSSPT